MKRTRLLAGLVALVCVAMTIVPTLAATVRSSEQIMSYSMDVTTGVGTLNTHFTVTGNGTMNKLGCQSIYVYQKTDAGWSYVCSVLENSAGMSQTNTYRHLNTIYIDSKAGVEYRVVVTIFAENSSGRDTRTQNFLVTGR